MKTEDMEKKIKYILCFVSSIVVDALGGWDIWLTALITTICLDILTGIIKSLLMKSNKTLSGGLNSKSMFEGGIKRIFGLLLVALATVLDTIISTDDTYIRVMVVSYYIANESLSILENIGACGIPLPQFLYSILDSLKNDKK